MIRESLQELYPKLNKEELQAVEERLSRYVELALEIYERIRSEPELYVQFKNLTATKSHPSMHAKRSNPP
jgi:hypothetical protein